MHRNEALAILGRHRDELTAHDVKALSLFGSVARDQAERSGDVDLLVEFSRPVGMFAFLRLKATGDAEAGAGGGRACRVEPDCFAPPRQPSRSVSNSCCGYMT